MEMKNGKGITGRLLLISATLVWGSSFWVLKDSLTKIGGGHFTFFVLAARFIIAAAILFFVCLKKFRNMTRTLFIKGLILGLILFGAYFVQTIGLKYTTPSKNAFLTSVYCGIVPFFSWIFLHRRPKIRN